MDKYEFNIKVEQIKKMVGKGDYETAMKIADTIDWRRVRNLNILTMAASIYEKNEVYLEAKDILLLAFERAPIGKRLLYKLAELAVKEGSVKEAEDYYREFCDLAPEDPRQYTLRYLILGAKGAPVEQLIHTLEQYCNIELDEKWLYELAELYAEAGMGDLCTMACDKIMLMFGLGKYVDKAMELKIQFAPLTKYQVDLVENRDKYEAKLRAVEQEYHMKGPARDYDQGSQKIRQLPRRTAEDESALAMEPQEEYPDSYDDDDYRDGLKREYPYPREEYPSGSDPQYSEEVRDGAEEYPYQQEGYPADLTTGYENGMAAYPAHYESYPDEYGDGPEDEHSYEPPVYQGETAGRYRESSGRYPEPRETYPEQEDIYSEGNYGEYAEDPDEYEPEHLPVTIEPEDSEEPSQQPSEAWIPAEPSKTMTDEVLRARIHEAEAQASLAKEMSKISDKGFSQEKEFAQTRVLTDIRDLNKPDPGPKAHHFMIEAATPQAGLAQAVDELKEIHSQTGAKNQAAKITGEKLNNKGIFAVADKLTGKDLIIEQAGDMKESVLQELNQLMARDETGMNVVLIDAADRLADLHKIYPGLAKRFEYVGMSELPQELPCVNAEGDRPVRHIQAKKQEEPHLRREKKPDLTARDMPRPENRPANTERLMSHKTGEPIRESTHQEAQERPVKVKKTEEKKEAAKPERPKSVSKPAAVKKDKPAPAKALSKKEPIPEPEPAPEPIEDQQEMDIDEFAQYACQYANDIDCSISGKSMLALYERIEILEEDGVPLIKSNAEEMIEDAADKAENPSFLKRLTGIFSSKYDKEGLLILKEEHFI